MASPNAQHPNSPYLSPTNFCFNSSSTNLKPQLVHMIQRQGLLRLINGTYSPPPEILANSADGAAVIKTNHDILRTDDIEVESSRDILLDLENKSKQPFDQNCSTGNTSEATTNYVYKAALEGDWVTAKQIIDDDPSTMNAKINFTQATALHIAVGVGNKAIHFVESLVTLMPDELIATKDDIGDTALNIAAAVGNISAATILVKRMPNLLYTQNNLGTYPVLTAAIYAQKNVLEYLISVTKDDCERNPYVGSSGLSLLIAAIDAEFFDVALYLVEKYPHLARVKFSTNSPLKSIAAKKSVFRPFNFKKRLLFPPFLREKTLRHSNDIEITATNRHPENLGGTLQMLFDCVRDSVSATCEYIYQELICAGFERTEEETQLVKEEAVKLVKCLCKEMESLNFIEVEGIYCDAILMAAQLGINEIVEEIVKAFPSAIYCSNPISFQNIFHVAVENRSEHVFNLVYQMSDHKHLFLDLPDINGNNLLHLAGKLAPSDKLSEISGAALQMQREIQWYKAVEKFVHPNSKERLNHSGKSPKTIFAEEHKNLKEKAEKWMKDTANSCTIIAALIGTIMFAAAITVPGGNNTNTGFPVFSNSSAFLLFAISDAISLLSSATSLLMFLDILTCHYAEEDFLYRLPERLILGLTSLLLSITFMMLTFSATLYLVFGQKQAWVLISVVVVACYVVWLFIFLQIPLLLDLITATYGSGIFRKQSIRPFY